MEHGPSAPTLHQPELRPESAVVADALDEGHLTGDLISVRLAPAESEIEPVIPERVPEQVRFRGVSTTYLRDITGLSEQLRMGKDSPEDRAKIKDSLDAKLMALLSQEERALLVPGVEPIDKSLLLRTLRMKVGSEVEARAQNNKRTKAKRDAQKKAKEKQKPVEPVWPTGEDPDVNPAHVYPTPPADAARPQPEPAPSVYEEADPTDRVFDLAKMNPWEILEVGNLPLSPGMRTEWLKYADKARQEVADYFDTLSPEDIIGLQAAAERGEYSLGPEQRTLFDARLDAARRAMESGRPRNYNLDPSEEAVARFNGLLLTENQVINFDVNNLTSPRQAGQLSLRAMVYAMDIYRQNPQDSRLPAFEQKIAEIEEQHARLQAGTARPPEKSATDPGLNPINMMSPAELEAIAIPNLDEADLQYLVRVLELAINDLDPGDSLRGYLEHKYGELRQDNARRQYEAQQAAAHRAAPPPPPRPPRAPTPINGASLYEELYDRQRPSFQPYGYHDKMFRVPGVLGLAEKLLKPGNARPHLKEIARTMDTEDLRALISYAFAPAVGKAQKRQAHELYKQSVKAGNQGDVESSKRLYSKGAELHSNAASHAPNITGWRLAVLRLELAQRENASRTMHERYKELGYAGKRKIPAIDEAGNDITRKNKKTNEVEKVTVDEPIFDEKLRYEQFAGLKPVNLNRKRKLRRPIYINRKSFGKPEYDIPAYEEELIRDVPNDIFDRYDGALAHQVYAQLRPGERRDRFAEIWLQVNPATYYEDLRSPARRRRLAQQMSAA